MRRPLVGAAGSAMNGNNPADIGSTRIGRIKVMPKSSVFGVGDVAALLTDG
jgi:hypothetical protein